MIQPTREQIAKARQAVVAELDDIVQSGLLGHGTVNALQTLIAATAEPNEQELAAKAARFACAATQQEPEPRDAQDVLDEYKDPTDERTVFGWIACAYIAGARGEEPR